MKTLQKPFFITAFCFLSGLVCIYTQQWLFRTGTDEKGLLISAHPGGIISLLILGVVAVLLLLNLRTKYTAVFARHNLSIVGSAFAALGYGCAAWIHLSNAPLLINKLAGIMGMVSCLCASVFVFGAAKNKKVHPLFFCPCVVFFMLHAVCRYQQWSGEPELLRYLFPLLASLGLMLTTYYRAAAEEAGNAGKAYLLFSRGALFCCLAAIPGTPFAATYGAMALYILLDSFSVAKQPQEE